MGSEQKQEEHMATFTSCNGGTHTMAMQATFPLQVVWDSLAFYFKYAAPSFQWVPLSTL